MTLELGRMLYFDIQNPILTIEIWANIVFWHSKSYLDIGTGAEYRILTFKLGPNIVFSHAKSYFDIQTGAEYRIMT